MMARGGVGLVSMLWCGECVACDAVSRSYINTSPPPTAARTP